MLMIERIQNFEGYFINDEGTTYIAFSMKEEDEVWSYLMTEEEFKRVWADKTAAQSWENFKSLFIDYRLLIYFFNLSVFKYNF